MNRRERTVAIISQNQRQPLLRAQHDIQIAVRFNVHRPRARVGSARQGLRQFRLRRHVGKLFRIVLPHQPHAARAGQHQVGVEVVVEINRQNPFGQRRRARSPAGKGKCRAG